MQKYSSLRCLAPPDGALLGLYVVHGFALGVLALIQPDEGLITLAGIRL